MNRPKLGIYLDPLGLPLRRALAEAARLGVGGVQVDAVGDLAPQKLSQTGRREFRNLLRSYNLELTALGCPLRRGLDVAENQQPRLEHVRNVMTLSFDLGPRLVVVEAGKVPDEKDVTRSALMAEALRNLGAHGDRTGTVLALETGLDSGETLAAYLGRFDSGALAANFDPANLLINGFDPIGSLRALSRRVAHAHARDARVAGASRTAQEVPLGQGDIDWLMLVAVFAEIEYGGWLAVERQSGDNRLADVANGVAFLRRLVG
jgi:sugar phosphate isomerase/epimerase